MKKRVMIIIWISLILIFLIYYQFFAPKIIKVSDGAEDEVYDDRDPNDVCKSLLKDIQNKNQFRNCRLIESIRVDSGDQNEEILCVNGIYEGGCFACSFKCD